MYSRLFAVCVAAQIIVTSSQAQFDENYGKLRPMDIEVKECSFDQSAGLVILLDEGKTDFNGVGEPVTYRHVRMKVLKEEGLVHAKFDLKFPGRWDRMQVDQLEGKTLNVDETGKTIEHEVDRKSVYNQKVNNYLRKITFAFPDVRIGSILEYRYRVTYTGTNWVLRDWNFQTEFPVYKSSYYYRSHSETEVEYKLQKRPEYQVSIKPQGKGDAVLFEMTNIPPLDNEPYMDSRENYLQKVKFHISSFSKSSALKAMNTSWDELAKFWNDRKWFGVFLNTVSRDINVQVASLTKGRTPLEKMRVVHDYVRNNIEFTGDQDFGAEQDLIELWHNKKGSSGDVNLLLVYMLRSAGLQADPVLVSEVENGRIEKNYIDVNQFSNVIAAVSIDGKRYFMDGTDKKTPAHLIQLDLLNTTGLIMRAQSAEFVTLEEQDGKDKKIIVIESVVDDKGNINGNVQVTSRDYSRLFTKNNYEDKKDEYITKHLLKGLDNVKVDSFKIANLDNDSLPLIQTFTFKTGMQHSGDYDFVPMHLFAGISSNPFIAESRVSNVTFGYKRSYTITHVVTLPSSKKIDAPLKNIQMVNEDKSLSFSRQVVYNEQANQLVVRMKFEVNKGVFAAEQYPDVREFYKKMGNLMEESCVLTNK